MLTQCKYAFRHNLSLRLGILLPLMAINILFGLLTRIGIWGYGGRILATTISSCGLATLMVIYIICDFGAIRSLFSAPNGYAYMLPPVKSWKLIAGRVISITVYDVLGFAIGTAGVLYQSFQMASVPQSVNEIMIASGTAGTFIILLGYLQFILAIFLAVALANSSFYKLRCRGVLGILSACLAFYLLSFLDLIHMPVNGFHRFGSLILIQVEFGLHPGMLLYVLVALLKIAILFGITTHLMERKINL